MPPTARQTLGAAAEQAAQEYLKKLGWRILDANWRKPWGELDIVAEHRGVVHIVEVKASRAYHAGFAPELRANGWKMHKVQRTAQTWLSSHRYSPDTEWQLDIVSVIMEGTQPRIELFEHAS